MIFPHTSLPHLITTVPETQQFHFQAAASLEISSVVFFKQGTRERQVKDGSYKGVLPVMLSVLTDIVNCSLLTWVLPAWKEYEVVSISKDQDHEIPNNNWPASPVPTLSKIC